MFVTLVAALAASWLLEGEAGGRPAEAPPAPAAVVAEAAQPADPGGGELAPGAERLLLRGRRILRGQIVERSEKTIVVARPDGLRVVVAASDLVRVFARDEVLPAPAEPGRVFLRDGRTVRAPIAARTEDGALVLEPDGSSRYLTGIRLITGPVGLEVRPGPYIPSPTGPPTRARFRLDGLGERPGVVLARSDEVLLAELDDGTRLAFVGAARRRVAPGDRLPQLTRRTPWASDPIGSRGLALPNAVVLPPGALVLSQAGQVSTIEVSPLRYVALSVGSALPLPYARDAGANLIASAKASLPLGRILRVAAGATGAAGAAGSVVFLFGAATIGGPELHATLYAGPPLPGSYAAGRFGDRVLAVSGAWRFLPNLGLATEHWLAGSPDDLRSAHALGVRWFHRRASVDLGVARVPATDWPIPWIGFGLALARGREVMP